MILKKRIHILALLVALVVAIVVGAGNQNGAAAARPSTSSGTTAVIRLDNPPSFLVTGASYTLTLSIDNVTNLGGFQTRISFNPDNLVVEGGELAAWLGSTSRVTFPLGPVIDNLAGYVEFGGASGDPHQTPGPSGSGPLYYLRVRAKAVGQVPLTFSNTLLADIQANPLPVSVQSANLMIIAPAGRAYLPFVARNQR
ncbi:MAG: hypothetical protein HY326_07390 [Chloroflexi bacterium]|nr:hypothetical protein [Chloroflexota bacterium]